MKRSLVFVILFAVGPAFGQAYVGGGLGSSSIVISDCGLPGFSCSTNDKANAIKAFGGYQLNKNVSFEGGYVNFGQFTQSASGVINGTRVNARETIDVDGAFADVLFTAPLNDTFGIFGRLGFLSWNVNIKASANAGGYTASGSQTASGVSPAYGVGIKIAASRKIELRGEVQRFTNIGDKATTGQSNADLVSASVLYRF